MDQPGSADHGGQPKIRRGHGKGSFVLGHGASGVHGHVELYVQIEPTPGHYSIEWRAGDDGEDSDVRGRVVAAADNYLREYVAAHPEYGLLVTIVDVASDRDRHNDHERATTLALRFALEDASLPVPQIKGA